MVDLEDFCTLANSFNETKLCELLDINPKTLKRWKSGQIKPPAAVRLILKFIHWGELSSIGGKDWEGFTINRRDHTLHIPGFSENREGFSPARLKALFFQVSYIPRIEAEIRKFKREAEAQQSDIRALTIANDFYRQQLKEAGQEFISRTSLNYRKSQP